MVAPKCSNEEFAATWRQYGGAPEAIRRILGYRHVRDVFNRRTSVERTLGIVLPSSDDRTNRSKVSLPKQGYRHIVNGVTGIVPVFSDAHFWPNEERSVAFQALLEVIREFKPAHVICNGDAFDGARISRHPPVGWIDLPDVADELAACQERLGEIEAIAKAANPSCKLYWNAGNHDSRFSARLAQAAPDYVRVEGTDLKDHFPSWSWAWSTEINGHTMVKHRYANGLHAAYNNVLRSGMSIVTGHLHRLLVTPWGDYNGRRYGVDTGTLSAFGPERDKFTWTEDNPLSWGEGFAVLTFGDKGKLLPPELCEVISGTAFFRGQAIIAKPVKGRKAP